MQLNISNKTKMPGKPRFLTLRASHKVSREKTGRRRNWKKVILTFLGVATGIVFVTGAIGTVLAVGYIGTINASLPDSGKIVAQDLEQSTKIYDRNDELLYTVHGDINREYTSLDKMPAHTKWALLATEDIDFYEHNGVDFPALVRVGLNLAQGKETGGGSTISQQLARITVLFAVLGESAFDRSITRKLKEILITFQLENKLTKDQILELYINEVPLGGTNYGYKTASRAYFNKELSDLTLSESAFLAGIIQSPSYYLNNLYNDQTEIVQRRRNAVLDQMLKHIDKTGVSKEKIIAAKEEPITLRPGANNIKAPHFVFYVIEVLEKEYGADVLRTGGLKVKTTLDLGTQIMIEEEIGAKYQEYKRLYGMSNFAAVATDPRNGEILAMSGSIDYNNTDARVKGNVNVTVMNRQMGSSVKPYTYIEAFKDGYHPGTPAPDIQMSFGNYKPENFNRQYEGLMSMSRALNQSRNIPAVYTLQTIGGPNRFVDAVEKLGITTLSDRSQYGLSLTLGAGDMKLLEHTNAYAAFANRGVYHDTAAIFEVTNSKGIVLFKFDPKKSERRVYSEEETYLLNWVICQIGQQNKHSAQKYLTYNGQRYCGKTGTTNGPKDLVLMTYYPRVSLGIWAGNSNGDIVKGSSFGQSEYLLNISQPLMTRLVNKYGYEFYSQPGNVTRATVCKDTGLLSEDSTSCEKESTVIIKSKTPAKDNAHSKIYVCTKNGKVPTNIDEAIANNIVQQKTVFDFSLANKSQQGAYDKYVREKLGFILKSEVPESAYCEPDVATPVITIVTPTQNSNYIVGQHIPIQVTLTKADTLEISSVSAKLDGTLIATKTSALYTFTTTAPSAGNHTITISVLDSLNRTTEKSVTITTSALVPTITITLSPTPTITPTVTPTTTP